ncbi:MAG: glycosyltransferase [Candidatus Riflebacteria bacterium]|nr:glycosyltransferase [Candidatus Riflebacteria bacterium]
MRIIQSLEGKSWSGGQQQALLLANGLKEKGHEVLLVCHLDGELEKRAGKIGIQVVPHKFRGEMNPISILKMNKIFQEFQPEIVNVHRAWAHTQWLIVSLFNRFKGLIVTRRVLFRPEKNPLSLAKYRSPVVKGFIAVSEAVSQRLQEQGVSGKKIKVVFSATDTERFDPSRCEGLTSELPFSEGTPFILFIGNYHPNKGHHVVVKAFDSIADKWPELRLVIAGNGCENEKFVREIDQSRNSQRINNLGFRTDIPALMKRAIAYTNASFEEGFSGTIRESLSMGLPVIASDIPANREIGKISPISFFKCGSIEDLGIRFLEMKNKRDVEFSKTLREGAVKFFGKEMMINNTLDAYRSFLRV